MVICPTVGNKVCRPEASPPRRAAPAKRGRLRDGGGICGPPDPWSPAGRGGPKGPAPRATGPGGRRPRQGRALWGQGSLRQAPLSAEAPAEAGRERGREGARARGSGATRAAAGGEQRGRGKEAAEPSQATPPSLPPSVSPAPPRPSAPNGLARPAPPCGAQMVGAAPLKAASAPAPSSFSRSPAACPVGRALLRAGPGQARPDGMRGAAGRQDARSSARPRGHQPGTRPEPGVQQQVPDGEPETCVGHAGQEKACGRVPLPRTGHVCWGWEGEGTIFFVLTATRNKKCLG
ncbi:uncharacterized protein LOC143820843 [Paroedura picta]|uniref:uncharacterized protein LOC143820843 n=1 Tax=Paroedura picta TaxID=143630 RepID=UPI004056C60F